MKIERFLPHLVTVALLAMSAIFRNPAYAFASMVSVLGILAHSVVVERMAALAARTPATDDGLKRAVQDMNARIATIEYGIKQRGF
jgi:hypothetical protein